MTEDEIVRWHPQLSGPEGDSEGHTQGDSEGQGSLACCSPRGHRRLNTTEGLTNRIWRCLPPGEMEMFSRGRAALLHFPFEQGT